jgi:hypothetical protein
MQNHWSYLESVYKLSFFVIPAEAGIQNLLKTLDSGWSLSLQVVSRETAGMTKSKR